MAWIALAALLASGLLISYQDMKTRLISLWLIVAFGIANAVFYLNTSVFRSLIENSLFCAGYLLLLYLVLLLYFYIKTRRFEKLTDTQIGWGDVFVMLAIGISLEPAVMIYFFSAAMVVSLLISLFFLKRGTSIPMAGLLVLNYLVFTCAGLFFGFGLTA